MIDLYLSLGSNQGDRQANMTAALNMLDERLGVHYSALSDIIETPSWGFDSDPFLNCAVLYTIPRKRQPAETQALEILSTIKEIERALGREPLPMTDASGNRIYHPRTIDIDILFFGKHFINTESLKIPHPLISQRDFVLVPLRQIAKPALSRAFHTLF